MIIIYKMPKYIDISLHKLPILYTSLTDTTTISGNTTVGNITVNGLIDSYGNIDTKDVIINDYKLKLRLKTDTDNFIQYNPTINGVSIQGYAGGRCGTTGGVANVIGWNTNSATITGSFNVSDTSTFNSVLIAKQIYETTIATTGTTSPFTCNMALGSTFYIPTDYTFASNFQIIITNVPTDTTKSYTISVIYRQPTTLFYINTARVSDTASAYLLGTVSTYSAPLFNGGLPVLSNTPNLVIQSFSIISTATSSSTFTRYITTSVNNHY